MLASMRKYAFVSASFSPTSHAPSLRQAVYALVSRESRHHRHFSPIFPAMHLSLLCISRTVCSALSSFPLCISCTVKHPGIIHVLTYCALRLLGIYPHFVSNGILLIRPEFRYHSSLHTPAPAIYALPYST